jgi:hypothetical protein
MRKCGAAALGGGMAGCTGEAPGLLKPKEFARQGKGLQNQGFSPFLANGGLGRIL